MMLKPTEQCDVKDECTFFKSTKFTLVDLMELLNDKHLNAILLDNKIYCGTKVVIHTENNNTLWIEGVISPEYYQVREIIYSKYYKV